MKFRKNRFGDYVSGDVTIVSPRFGRWIVTVKGEPVARTRTLREAKEKVSQ